jgi:hypothetical protein
MCGLWGIYCTEVLTNNEKDLFQALGILSSSRGVDATGFLSIDTVARHNQEDKVYYGINKAAKKPYEFFDDKEIQSDLKTRTTALLGHNRHATIGEKNVATAHPFEHDVIVGCHNGTIRNYATTDDLSDSDRFYKRVAELGLKEALNELPHDAAYALTFWDMDENSVNFFRNNQRSLFYCPSLDGKTVIWASEARFIKGALEFMEMGKSYGETSMVKRNTHFKLTRNASDRKIKWSVAEDYLSKEIIDKHERKYAGTTGSVTWTYQGGHTYYPNRCNSHDYWRDFDKKQEEARALAKKESEEYSTYLKTVFKTEEAPAPETSVETSRQEEVKPKEVRPFRPTGGVQVTYTYWPLQQKVSKRTISGPRGSNYDYEDIKPESPDFHRELRNCQRFIHITNGGVFIDVDADEKHLRVTLPSSKTKVITHDDIRFGAWRNLMFKMNVEWNCAMREAREKGTSSFNIRFYPWNVAHSFVAANLGIYADEKENENIDAEAEKFEADNVVSLTAKEVDQSETEGKKRNRPDKRSREATATEGTTIDEGSSKAPWEDFLNDEIPFGQLDTPYYIGWQKQALPLDKATKLLRLCCYNCFEESTIEDKVYWVDKDHLYICTPCADLPVVHDMIDMSQSTLGKKVA